MKIVTIIGARPQFIKSAPVSRVLRDARHYEYGVHTGQHYDYEMSQIFFDEMGIPHPQVNLGVGSGQHGHQTAQMLAGIEDILIEQKPDWVLVYGDTNSTLAGALAAVKLHLPVAHVEAGLRSFNRQMPEEHNRVLTDHCADLLLCPTQTAVNNLAREGITAEVHQVGDTMLDAVLQFVPVAEQRSTVLANLGIEARRYLLATIHRPQNTDNLENLKDLLATFNNLNETVVFPVHPRTRQRIETSDLPKGLSERLRLIAPVGYLDMLILEQNARLILTDSGGIQKEAYFLGVPCVTLRTETEWVETVEAGWNIVVGPDKAAIVKAIHTFVPPDNRPTFFGDGQAAQHIVSVLEAARNSRSLAF